MKHSKILSMFAAALVGLSAAAFPPAVLEPVSIVAEAAVVGDWEYTVSSGKVTITGYTGTATNLSIPRTIGGKDVVAIGEDVFFANMNLISVFIPSNVTTIKKYAFQCCNNLQTVEIQGAAHIGTLAFGSCRSLTNAKMHKNCVSDTDAFEHCTSLTNLNGVPAWTESSGKPVFNSSTKIRKLVRNNFAKSQNVKFVDDYCTALCNYVVATETRPWMCEAVKARQLFRWLCDNCHFETDNTTFYEPENQLYSSVFLSYGVDGEGESVCSGYAKAYGMLLTAAGLENYLVHSDLNDYGLTQVDLEYWGIAPGSRGGHAWNLVKADGKYYQCDASAADTDADQSRRYMYFLQTDFSMFNMHNNYYNSTGMLALGLESHPYLPVHSRSATQAAINQCVYSFSDAAYDGILDFDFDFDGIANTWIDNYILSRIAAGDCNLNGVAFDEDDLVWNQIFFDNPTHDTWLNMCIVMFPNNYFVRG